MSETSHDKPVGILILNGLVVTMAADGSIVEAGGVAIQGGVIQAVGPSAVLAERYTANKVIDAGGKIVMPGLINTHTHASMALFRGLADDVPLKVWLEQHIWPAEGKYLNRETIVLGAKLAFAEMLRSGTTTFNDMYFFADEIATTAKQTGIRAVVGEGILDFPTPSVRNPVEALRRTEELIGKWQGDSLIRVAAAAHSPYACSESLLREAKELAGRHGVPLHIHVAETKGEVEGMLARTGLTPVAYLNRLGFLGENVVAVHAVHLTDEDIRLLAESHAGVSHNPISNAKLGSGVAPIPKLLKAGVRVGLGTDSAASNNRLDLFREIAMAALIHKAVGMDPEALDAYTVLKMATIDAARILGMEKSVGSLEAGKRADLLIIDGNSANMKPMYNLYSHLVYAMNSTSVESVIVDGRMVMEKHRLLTLDESAILEEVSRLGERIQQEG